jgi:putative transposase
VLRKPVLGGRTPLEAWKSDPTPTFEVPEKDLALFTLEEVGKPHPITTSGVSFLSRLYVGPCMVGKVGTLVRVRWLPNHPEIIEIFHAHTGEHLGPAYPSNEAGPEQVKELMMARRHEAKQLKKAFKAADRSRRVRYAAATEPGPPQILGSVSALEAETEIAASGRSRAAAYAKPDLFEPGPPASSWALPRPARAAETLEGEQDGTAG